MIVTENYLGKITFSEKYIKSVVNKTVSECFGVAGMSCINLKEYAYSKLFGKKLPQTGIRVSVKNNEVSVKLHILAAYGTNISAVVSSIKNKVRFALTEVGVSVRSVNVYVDNIRF